MGKDRDIKELEETWWKGDDYSKSFDPLDFGKKINEIIQLLNDHEKRVGHATGRV